MACSSDCVRASLSDSSSSLNPSGDVGASSKVCAPFQGLGYGPTPDRVFPWVPGLMDC